MKTSWPFSLSPGGRTRGGEEGEERVNERWSRGKVVSQLVTCDCDTLRFNITKAKGCVSGKYIKKV